MASSEEKRRVARGLSGIVDEEPLSAWDEVYAVLFGSHRNPVYIDSYDMIDISIRTLAGIIDPGDDVSVSAYDLLSEDDRDALAWVREHGGLDALRHRVDVALAREPVAIGVCSLLGMPDDSLAGDVMDEIRARTMPEGMHLPKDRDGREFWPSQPVWIDGQKMRVVAITHKDKICVRKWEKVSGGGGKWVESTSVSSEELPMVTDADGVEIREGEIVYATEDEPDCSGIKAGDPVTVAKMNDCGSLDVISRGGIIWSVQAKYLTHERPDSWERLEHEAVEVADEISHKFDSDDWQWARDKVKGLVLRARALAGRGES